MKTQLKEKQQSSEDTIINYLYQDKPSSMPLEAFIDVHQLNNVLELRYLTIDKDNLTLIFDYIASTLWDDQISKIDAYNSGIDLNFLRSITDKPILA